MANIVCNIALGRTVEFYNRVKANDPANAALVWVLLAASSLPTDTTLKDQATLAAVLALATEATNTGYTRKVMTDADLAAWAPDLANDRVDLDCPDQTWTGLQGDGSGAIGKALLCYDPDTTSGTDATIIPLCAYDFAITPDGSTITAQINAAGFFRAS